MLFFTISPSHISSMQQTFISKDPKNEGEMRNAFIRFSKKIIHVVLCRHKQAGKVKGKMRNSCLMSHLLLIHKMCL